MANEKVVFDVDVSRYLQGIAAIQAKEKELRRDQKATATAVSQGSKEAVASYMQQAGMLQKLSIEKKKLNQQFSVATGATQQFGRSMGQTNMIIQQGVFAVDDFLTVVGQQGLAGGLRAAGNNLSLILSMFNPWLALLPAAATAIATFALKTDQSADATDKAKDSLDRYKDAIVGIQEEIKKAQSTSEEWTRHQESMPARKEIAKQREELRKAEVAERESQKTLDDYLSSQKNLIRRNPQTGQLEIQPGTVFNRPIARAVLGQANQYEVERNRARSSVNDIRDRIETVQTLERRRAAEVERRQQMDAREREIRDAVDRSISQAGDEMDQQYRAPRFGILNRDIMRTEKAVEAARNKYEDASIAARRPGSDKGRKVSKDEQANLDSLRDMKELLERQLKVLNDMKEAGDREIDRGLMIGRSGQEAV